MLPLMFMPARTSPSLMHLVIDQPSAATAEQDQGTVISGTLELVAIYKWRLSCELCTRAMRSCNRCNAATDAMSQGANACSL